jgi:hypothetical protein
MGVPPQDGEVPIKEPAMLDPLRPAIWLVWRYISSLERLLFGALIVLGIYVVFSAATTVLSVRKIRASLHTGNSADADGCFIGLRKRSARVDRLITAAFYLFGVVLFLGLQGAYFTIDDSTTPVGWSILRGLEPHFAFASNVFFMLLILHLLGWFISHWIGRLTLHSTPRDVQ